jgi:hypothetical protein
MKSAGRIKGINLVYASSQHRSTRPMVIHPSLGLGTSSKLRGLPEPIIKTTCKLCRVARPVLEMCHLQHLYQLSEQLASIKIIFRENSNSFLYTKYVIYLYGSEKGTNRLPTTTTRRYI